jgi:hypothetical protein
VQVSALAVRAHLDDDVATLRNCSTTCTTT